MTVDIYQDDFVTLYLGLQSLKGTRASLKDLQKWKTTNLASNLLNQAYWVVAK